MVPAVAGELGLARAREHVALIEHPSGGRQVEAPEDVQERGLAAAGGAEQDQELAGHETQIHAAERVHLHLAHLVGLGQGDHLEHRSFAPRSRSPPAYAPVRRSIARPYPFLLSQDTPKRASAG
jgi:hypothetical protein